VACDTVRRDDVRGGAPVFEETRDTQRVLVEHKFIASWQICAANLFVAVRFAGTFDTPPIGDGELVAAGQLSGW
jgi:hypothetical protein